MTRAHSSARPAALHAPLRSIGGAACGAVASLALAIALLSPASARAAEPACAAPRWSMAPELGPPWTAVLPAACALAEAPESDPAAQIHLAPAPGDALAIEVALPDGRTARRVVRTPGELMTTLQALLALPGKPRSPAVTTPPLLVAGPAMSTAILDPGSAAKPAFPWAFEGGATVGAGWEGSPGQVAGNVGAFAGVQFGDLEVLLGLRWEPLRWYTMPVDPSLELDSLGVQVGVLRVLSQGRGHRLDVGLTSLFSTELQSVEDAEGEHAASGTDLRLGLLLRGQLGEGPLRWLLTLDAGCSPLRLGRSVRLDPALPVLPACGGGLAIGAVWRG